MAKAWLYIRLTVIIIIANLIKVLVMVVPWISRGVLDLYYEGSSMYSPREYIELHEVQ